MIEKFCILIIQELGPTGLLVVGLYIVLGKPLKKIADHVANINDEGAKIIELLNRVITIWNGKKLREPSLLQAHFLKSIKQPSRVRLRPITFGSECPLIFLKQKRGGSTKHSRAPLNAHVLTLPGQTLRILVLPIVVTGMTALLFGTLIYGIITFLFFRRSAVMPTLTRGVWV